MKTVLLVDNDRFNPTVVRAAFALHPEFRLVLASSFHDALWVLCDQEVDLVITHLELPEQQGLHLLAYMANYRSKVPVLTMSHPRQARDAQGSLCWRGHLSTPLEPRGLMARVYDALRSAEQGEYRPVGLHDVLRVLSHVQESCILQVKQGLKSGHFKLVRGRIQHMGCGKVEGEAAFRELLSWKSIWVRVEHTPSRLQYFLLAHEMPTAKVA